jgi:glycosyltransferase involved in cell wall biosynthesis
MKEDPGMLPAEMGKSGGWGAAIRDLSGPMPPSRVPRALPGSPLGEPHHLAQHLPPGVPRAPFRPRNILFVAWRDLANRRAGGSEVLVDRLASGMLARGDRVTLLCGGPTAERPYQVVRNGGTYSQFLRAPFSYLRNFRDYDLIVEVCNGMPYLAPLWCRRPVICLVNHVHSELWSIRFRPPVSTIGRGIEGAVMPWVHRKNLFLTVSASTAEALEGMGVGKDRIRQICNGVEQPDPLTQRSTEPLFLALGRLTDYKRLDLLLRLWDRVRHVVGGRLVIAGDGPERARLEALAGPDVIFTGRVSEQEKHRLLCSAWLLMHPALIEGWGIVVAEAAIRGTPAVAFDVPGLRDSVVHGETGMLVRTEGQFASTWASLAIDKRRREALGRAARNRALRLHWSAAVEGFAQIAQEAIERGGSSDRAGNRPDVQSTSGVLRKRARPAELGSGPGPAPGPDAGQAAAGCPRPGRHHRCGMRRWLSPGGGIGSGVGGGAVGVGSSAVGVGSGGKAQSGAPLRRARLVR